MLFLLLVAAAVAKTTSVGCIGDSITQGGCRFPANQTYVAQLAALLGPGFTASNFGVSGTTMLTNGLCGSFKPQSSNCAWTNTSAYPAALASVSDVYTVLLGTNDAKQYNWAGVQGVDTADSFALDYLTLLQRLRGVSPSALLYAVTPIPVFTDGQYGMNATFVTFIAAQVRRIAPLAGALVVDLAVEFGRQGGSIASTCDGVHPTAAGNAIIARVLARRILADVAARKAM